MEQLEGDPSAVRHLGVATTADELAQVNRVQDRSVAVLQELAPKLEADRTFGGLWFDFPNETIEIATTANTSPFDVVLAPHEQAGVRFRVRTVAYTETQLRLLQARVDADAPMWRAQGIEFATVGVDVEANRLEVTVVALTSAKELALINTYGSQVRIAGSDEPEFAACLSRGNCSAPIKGG